MERKKRKIIYWLATVIAVISFISLIITLSPAGNIQLGILKIPSLFLFFVALAFATYFISGLIMKNAIHGVLISAFTLFFFLLRLNNLRNPLFLVLLLALFVVLEIMLSSRKDAV